MEQNLQNKLLKYITNAAMELIWDMTSTPPGFLILKIMRTWCQMSPSTGLLKSVFFTIVFILFSATPIYKYVTEDTNKRIWRLYNNILITFFIFRGPTQLNSHFLIFHRALRNWQYMYLPIVSTAAQAL